MLVNAQAREQIVFTHGEVIQVHLKQSPNGLESRRKGLKQPIQAEYNRCIVTELELQAVLYVVPQRE